MVDTTDGRLPLDQRIAFWAKRVDETPDDFLSPVQLALAEAAQARSNADPALYEKASRVNEYPWLADLVIARANKSPRILRRMSAVLEEQGNPGNLFSVRGILRLFVPIP